MPCHERQGPRHAPALHSHPLLPPRAHRFLPFGSVAWQAGVVLRPGISLCCILAEEMGRHKSSTLAMYMTQPRKRLNRSIRQALHAQGAEKHATVTASSRGIKRSMTLPARYVGRCMSQRRSACMGSCSRPSLCSRSSPDTQRAEQQKHAPLLLDTPAPAVTATNPAAPLTWQRPTVDTQALDSANAFAAVGRDFKRSPLGRSVITALEVQLDHVCAEAMYPFHSSPSASQRRKHL